MQQHGFATPLFVRLFEDGGISGHSEWQLLDRFVRQRDELAFEALVSRHGPMVLGICRRMLGVSSDVDDAFQATFLVLLKRAHTLGPRDAVAAWLHGVAVRVARRARSDAFKRGRREKLGIVPEPQGRKPVEDNWELRHILDEEINRLPLKYRAPIVLCYLEDHTHEEAARQLNWPIGTVKGRLSRARALLESRLTRRGVACSAGLVCLAQTADSHASTLTPLLEATCKTASHLCNGKLTTHVVSASVARLLQGVLFAMLYSKLKMVAIVLLVSTFVLAGAGVMARQQGGRGEDRSPLPKAAESLTGKARSTDPELRKAGVSLPRSEAELYREIVDASRQAYIVTSEEYRAGHTPLERAYHTSRLLMEAERDAAKDATGRVKAVEEHFKRLKELRRNEEEYGDGKDANATEARAYLAEADLWLAQAKAPKPQAGTSPVAVQDPSGKPGKDPRSLAVIAKLEMPVAMSFPNETPLEDVLKYIKQATTSPDSSGIPIYIDPMGLQEAERTMTSTIQIDLEGVPLRRTLQLALKQLGLVYFVDDGILCITNEASSASKFDSSMLEVSPFLEKQEKAERGELSVEEMKELVEILRLQKEMRKLKEEPDRSFKTPEKPQVEQASKKDPLEPILKKFEEFLGQLKAERDKTGGGNSN
jgi:RNA polymerase sigma factor (sigma-70 family)